MQGENPPKNLITLEWEGGMSFLSMYEQILGVLNVIELKMLNNQKSKI